MILSDYGDWTAIGSNMISGDAKYIAYTFGAVNSAQKLILQDRSGKWKAQYANVTDAAFSIDSKQFLCLYQQDSLTITDLLTRKQEIIPSVASFKVATMKDAHWMAYQHVGDSKSLILHNLFSGEERGYPRIEQYWFMDNGQYVLMQQSNEPGSRYLFTLFLLDIAANTLHFIKNVDEKINSVCLDAFARQITFIADSKITADRNKSLYYYHLGADSAREVYHSRSGGTFDDAIIADAGVQFSKDGKTIFLRVNTGQKTAYYSIYAGVEIWNYEDKLLAPAKKSADEPRDALASFNVEKGTINVLEGQSEEIIGTIFTIGNDYVLVRKIEGDRQEYYWNAAGRADVFLVNVHDGSRRLVKDKVIPLDLSINFVISPKEGFVMCYDMTQRSYSVFSIATGEVKNISQGIPFPLYDDENDLPRLPRSLDAPVWFPNDSAVLICDNYDIWQLDPTGLKSPTNITSGYGRQNKIVLRIMPMPNKAALSSESNILLSAFNKTNKYTGFYSVRLGEKPLLKRLTIGPYMYYYPFSSGNISTDPPVQSANGEYYLLKRMSPTEAPNLFLSKDLVHFSPITNFNPHQRINWMKTDLVHWNTFDSSSAEGILYKPENFDSTKQYPVIIHFYERDADELFAYRKPNLSDGRIDIPYFVSNGYIVFDPSIHYKLGHPGASTYNAVVSGAKYLAKFKWVDSTKIGVQGISYGGYQVNYLITHTNIFAAACESAGSCDFVSAYGSLRSGKFTMHYIYEEFQSRIGATLWTAPDLYINNSPIFNVDKVTTPLLIMHNKEDKSVAFAQGAELFTALRRLHKKAWLLQYWQEGHGLEQQKNKEDFTIRLHQYFDYYLKGKPMPQWMVVQ